jgi:nucleotide-binding universal stress UspA family protein
MQGGWDHATQAFATTNPFALRNILLATDLSSAANNALRYAAYLARRCGATLFSVHVVHPDVDPFHLPETWPQTAAGEGELRQIARRETEELLPGFPHLLIFERGPIWRTISRVIEAKEIDLLVVGTHGRSGFSKVLMGSVAEQIFRRASCPVLTVGPAVRIPASGCPDLERVLYATDFSCESLAAAPLAISLVRVNHAQLILLHCASNSEEESALLDSLRDVVPTGAGLTNPPTSIVAGGSHREAILKIAAQEQADLVVLGVHSSNWRLMSETRFVNSTAYQIATQADCPVLTVRS